MAFLDHPLMTEEFRIVAYRGGSAERPENTLEAFDRAASIAPSIVLELDIRRTSDGVLVAAHDDDLGRTTGKPLCVSRISHAELAELDAGYGFERAGEFPFRERGSRVPRVEEVLSSFPNHCCVLDVHSDHPRVVREVVDLVKRQRAASRVVIASERPQIVRELRKLQPGWLCCATSSELLSRVLLERVKLDAMAPRTGGMLMIPEMHRSLCVLTPRFVQRARARNERIWVWVVEEVEEMRRLRGLGADGVFTPSPTQFWNATLAQGRSYPG
ncbi:MAG TPA: glycerophosphodiester phosphodiesterase family protein [Polyangiaceae bacterium]|nr:glycerophosphodiester phosphodiesterase family protein [Polyangiaceae bacterium]